LIENVSPWTITIVFKCNCILFKLNGLRWNWIEYWYFVSTKIFEGLIIADSSIIYYYQDDHVVLCGSSIIADILYLRSQSFQIGIIGKGGEGSWWSFNFKRPLRWSTAITDPIKWKSLPPLYRRMDTWYLLLRESTFNFTGSSRSNKSSDVTLNTFIDTKLSYYEMVR
jgi:hypothetical protein